MNGSVLEEKSFLKMLQLYFSSELDWGLLYCFNAKNTSKKIGALIHSLKGCFLWAVTCYMNMSGKSHNWVSMTIKIGEKI